MKAKNFPIFLAFFAMGFGDVVGPLVGLVKDSFAISNFMAQLVTFSGFIMFGLLSVPLGVYQDKKGKKFILMLGLSIALIGLILPMVNGMYGVKTDLSDSGTTFYFLLISILLLGAGATTLQVAGNPIMRDVSDEGKFSSNLSLAQSIKAIGSSMGFLVPPFVLIQFGLDWSVLFPIFAFVIAVTLVSVGMLKVIEKKDQDSSPASFASSIKLLFNNSYVLMMVLGIFLYVGAEVSMSSGVPILLKESFGMERFGLTVSWALFFLPILIGRFAGSAILRILEAKKFLVITSVLSIAGVLLLLLGNEFFALSGVVLTGLGFANIFPLIFSITVDKIPAKTNELSGLMVTAIVGGAIIPPIMGLVADNTSTLIGFVVPLSALIYIGWVALINLRK
ncbi:MAG: MFS transporter [Ignavibacteriales bacterium]|nr:MFS transporter [Ignavibacteriales bacterium]MCF8306787.1 MFS transporter [Ignavibacteriales bacterium]MCF8316416.1 MFS transporter [Ignavibacteriales bacterium]MCF8437896.1 MFS transporter [Ignavibacteriales bacterium]